MAEDSALYLANTYTNPVYPHSFPDPFVLKFCGEYFAYCTGFSPDGRVFGVLKSCDLVTWHEAGGAMRPLDHGPPFYWAPEVTYDNGKFYLYYSVGNEALMEIRVAVSEKPDGGFIDSGKILTSEEFAIDAHVFADKGGRCYLFYATDFLEYTHIGTGTVVDEMIDHFTLAGNPRPVTRAKYDWQIYDPNRAEKGGVRWHTVEGPFVIERKGIYYEMFSGGNWKNVSYGVSFAIADDIGRDEEWQQFSDGEKVFPILRTLPGKVTGPGHNCVIRGPNNRELYCVYHSWVKDERVLAIDRMDFVGKRIFISGATYTPQAAPYPPAHIDFFDAESLSGDWQANGNWSLTAGQAIAEISDDGELICRQKSAHFLCEFSLRLLAAPDENSGGGFCLRSETENTLEFLICPNKGRVEITFFWNGEKKEQSFDLPGDFSFNSFHLLRVEVDGAWVKVLLDENTVRFEKTLTNVSTFSSGISLRAVNMRAAFAGFALTNGFEELFAPSAAADPELCGWKKLTDAGDWRIEEQQLFLTSREAVEMIVSKGRPYKNYEFAANIRLLSHESELAFGFLLLNDEEGMIRRFGIERESAGYYLSTEDRQNRFPLPDNFAPTNYHQFRFLCTGDTIRLQMDEIVLGEVSVPEAETRIGVFCQNSVIALDMVRLTVL